MQSKELEKNEELYDIISTAINHNWHDKRFYAFQNNACEYIDITNELFDFITKNFIPRSEVEFLKTEFENDKAELISKRIIISALTTLLNKE